MKQIFSKNEGTLADGFADSDRDAFLTKGQVAKLLQVSARTIDTWMSDGTLPYRRFGRTVRFFRKASLRPDTSASCN